MMEEEASPAPEPVDLSLLLVDWNEASRQLYEDELLPQFSEANPGLTVSADWTGWGELDAKVMTAFAGGLQPDLFQADNVEFGPKYYARDIIIELQPYVDVTPNGEALIADFYEKAITEGASIGGKLVALPYVLDNRGLFYRKDFFAEAGLDPEKGPENWDEFRAAAIATTIRDGDVFERAGYHAWHGPWSMQEYVPFLWQNGGSILNETNDEAVFNSPEAVEALALWANLLREDRVGPLEDMPAVGDMGPYTAGTQTMRYGGYWTLQNVQSYAPEIWDSVGITILGQKQKASLWYANTFFLSDGDNTDGAWTLLSHLVLDDDNFRRYHEASGGLPPRKSIIAEASHITPLHLVLAEDVMAAPGSHTTPAVPFTLEIIERMDEAIAKALEGQATPQEALDVAVAESNQIIARHLGG
jgi:ABC-type glycerol-3-phosphate transport system substrate-binding protein